MLAASAVISSFCHLYSLHLTLHYGRHEVVYFGMNQEAVFNYLNLTPILKMNVLCKD